MAVDLFKKIDNTVFDLQASHAQTYKGLLKKLAHLLQHEDLEKFNSVLTQNIDFNHFMQLSHATNLGMTGTSELQWTGDDKYDLGLKYILIQHISNYPEFCLSFAYEFFSNYDNNIIFHIHNMVRGLIIPFVRDYKDYIASVSQINSEHPKVYENKVMAQNNKKIFLVHGHEDYATLRVARFLEQNDFQVIILHEQASGGKTIIEKIEAHSDVGFAVILLTPDDVGKAKNEDNLQFRARQNVILELGYFMGKLGRNKVCTFKSGKLEVPTDFSGIIWNDLDEKGIWKQTLSKELSGAGYDLDHKRFLISLA